MITTLCDVKVSCLRPRGYNNLGEWLQDPNHVYIARNTFGYRNLNSPFANPFKVKDGLTLQSVMELYWNYIVPKIDSGELYTELFKLKGKELGCWCVGNGVHINFQPPFQCHGQVLMWLINHYFPESNNTTIYCVASI